MIFLFLIIGTILQAQGYSLPCLAINGTCVTKTKSIQAISLNGTLWSAFQPENLCNSCAGNSTCNNTHPACVKQLVNLTSVTVSSGDLNLTLDSYIVNSISYNPNLPFTEMGLFLPPGQAKKNLKRNFEALGAVVSYSDGVIYVTTDDQYHTYVTWVLNEYNGDFYCTEDCNQAIPTSYLNKDGFLKVKVFILDVLVKNSTFPIDATKTCEIRHCSFVCMDYITNFVCYSLSTQVIVATAFFLSIASSIIFICIASYKIYCCCSNRYMIQMPKGAEVIACILIISLLSPGVSAQCTTTTILESSINSCSISEGNYTCLFQTNVLVNLLHLGSKACIAFKSTDGTYLGSMNLTYELSLYYTTTVPSYFSGDWDGVTCSHRSCRNDYPCDLGNGCPSDQAVINSALNGECLLYNGYSECYASCGCAGCGCFFCSDACLLARTAFKPTSMYWVWDILGTTVVPRVRLSTDINGTRTESILDVDTPTLSGDFTISVIGTYDTFTPNWGNQKFIKNYAVSTGDYYIAPASNYQNPVFQLLGDIQSSTSGGILNAPSSFIFPSTAVPAVVQQYALENQFPASGYDIHINNNNKLPKQIAGILWSYDFPLNKLIGNNVNAPAVALSVSTQNPIKLSYDKTSVCPKASFVSVNGCYNCPQGFSITYTVKSVCDSGSVTIDVISSSRIECSTRFVSIGTNTQTSIIYCISQDAQISGTVKLIGDSTDSFSFLTVLNEAPPLTPEEIRRVFGNWTPGAHNDFISLWDSFTGSAAIAKWTIAVTIGIVAIFLVVLVLYGSYVLYKKRDMFQTFINRQKADDDEGLIHIGSDYDDYAT
jgi:hypothetical protein